MVNSGEEMPRDGKDNAGVYKERKEGKGNQLPKAQLQAVLLIVEGKQKQRC